MTRKIILDPEPLYDLYWNEQLPIIQVANRLNVGRDVVRNQMKHWQIPMRSKAEEVHIRRANHVTLTDEALSFIQGHLLGDGSMISRSPFSARYSQVSKHKKYVEWLDSKMNSYGIERVGRITKQIRRRKPPWNNSTVFHYSSKTYSEFRPIFDRWYSPEREPPPDFKIDALSLAQWLMDDGSLLPIRYHNGGLEYPIVALANFKFSLKWKKDMAEQIKQIGINCTGHKEGIRICSDSLNMFFEFIGPCPVPHVFGYKWPREGLSKQLRLF